MLIALVVTFDGFPLRYEVFAGNTHDVWIADRENLPWLRDTGGRYIIGAPRS